MSNAPETRGGHEPQIRQKFQILFPGINYPVSLDDFFIIFLNLSIDKRINIRESFWDRSIDENIFRSRARLYNQRKALLFECIEDFGIIIPSKYPPTFEDVPLKDQKRPDAPEGKRYFDDWYKEAWQKFSESEY